MTKISKTEVAFLLSLYMLPASLAHADSSDTISKPEVKAMIEDTFGEPDKDKQLMEQRQIDPQTLTARVTNREQQKLQDTLAKYTVGGPAEGSQFQYFRRDCQFQTPIKSEIDIAVVKDFMYAGMAADLDQVYEGLADACSQPVPRQWVQKNIKTVHLAIALTSPPNNEAVIKFDDKTGEMTVFTRVYSVSNVAATVKNWVRNQ